jgi:PAS domain S-box-containing protein
VTLGSIADGVIATDLAGGVSFINRVAQDLTGWSEAEAAGRPLGEVFRIANAETGEPVECPVGKVIRSGRRVGLANHTLLEARDGTRRPVDSSAAPIQDDDGRFVGVVLVFRDITERQGLEAELRRRSDDLVERDRRKDEFLAMLAHELRNPLAPIRNTIQILKRQFAGNGDFERANGVMERQVTHLVRLVDDLLDVARITQGKLELRKGRVELAAVVNRALEEVRPYLDERQHRLELALPPGPVELEADSARLAQVLSNLLTNAAKYTPPGGTIRLTACREGGEAVLRVRDNGIGIKPELIGHIFGLFQQADRVPGRVAEGLGIGLSLVRSLAEMHGGSVSAHSEGPSQGSEFVVRLPALPPGAGLAFPGEEEWPAVPPLRVLITDDNVDSAESLATLLRLFGHEVRTAHDGLRALEVVRDFHPQAVFLDIGLPRGMDGYELARRLRGQEGLGRALLVAMTGFGTQDDVRRARAAGFDHHMVKPADPGAIQRLLASAVGRC